MLYVKNVPPLESPPLHLLELIRLRDFAELTIAEMTGQLGLQVPGVKRWLHRARELVREYGAPANTGKRLS